MRELRAKHAAGARPHGKARGPPPTRHSGPSARLLPRAPARAPLRVARGEGCPSSQLSCCSMYCFRIESLTRNDAARARPGAGRARREVRRPRRRVVNAHSSSSGSKSWSGCFTSGFDAFCSAKRRLRSSGQSAPRRRVKKARKALAGGRREVANLCKNHIHEKTKLIRQHGVADLSIVFAKRSCPNASITAAVASWARAIKPQRFRC
jgi:hypothetical protein